MEQGGCDQPVDQPIQHRKHTSLISEPPQPTPTQLSLLFRFAARLWLRELDQPTLDELGGPLSETWTAIGGVIPNESLEDLQADFCQLLAHPKSYIAPFQSVWTTGELGGPSVSSMQNWMSETGYAAEVAVDEISDHLGVQLDLYGWMIGREAVNESCQSIVSEVANRFAMEHLRWTDNLLQRACEVATTEFYRSVASVTRELLASGL